MGVIIKILSAGVIASFITGLFSLVISIKSNKRLLEIERMKQKYDINIKRYELLTKYLKEIMDNREVFEFDGHLYMDYGSVRKLFSFLIDRFSFLIEQHSQNEYLFSEKENCIIKKKINEINFLVDEFVERFNECDPNDAQDVVVHMDKIGIQIEDFSNFYVNLIKKEMQLILNES